MIMLRVFYAEIIMIGAVQGFLFGQNNQDGNRTDVNNQYVSQTKLHTVQTVLEQENDELRHKLRQMQIDSQNALSVLSSQIQEQFYNMEQIVFAMNSSIKNDKESESVEIAKHYSFLQQNFEALQGRCKLLETELQTVKNSEKLLQKKLESLEQLDAIKQLGTLNLVEQKVQEIESKTHALSLNEQARRNDFIALHNETMVNSKNIAELTRKVALTACGSGSYGSGTVIKFQMLKTQVGVNDSTIANFTKTGKFVCEFAGLYTVAVTAVSSTPDGRFALFKNGKYIMHTFIARDTSYHAASMDFGITLQENDKVWIQAQGSLYVDGEGTCLTIIKIR